MTKKGGPYPDGTVQFSMENETIATTSHTGVVTAQSVGVTVLTGQAVSISKETGQAVVYSQVRQTDFCMQHILFGKLIKMLFMELELLFYSLRDVNCVNRRCCNF